MKFDFSKYKYLAIILLVGICFVVMSYDTSSDTVIITQDESFDVIEVEKRLEDIISKISGVGDVRIMLTVKNGIENIFANNTTEEYSKSGDDISKDISNEIVFETKSSGQKEPIKIVDIYPEFLGALIVCEGGDNDRVRLEILNAIKSLCDISSDKITISKMKE